MQLAHMCWLEVDSRIAQGAAVILPVGSTEQHGPMGMIGTDAICAAAIALHASEHVGAIVAPALAYTPAPFNTGFPGTVSLSEPVFEAMAGEVISGLLAQGFAGVFVVNGHGANLAPLQRIAAKQGPLQIRSWWEPDAVQSQRRKLYGDWEGMHATPSEVAITQALLHPLPANGAEEPPRALSAEYIRDHAGDRHGAPEAHRAEFPDGRVGSHSFLATPEDGAALLALASEAIAEEFVTFQTKCLDEKL
ncbi:MAG: creatininase family protein [Arenibacterium sp.]